MANERVERRLAAILAADVAGYSRLMGRDEEGTLAAPQGLPRELIDPKIAEHRGRMVKTTGDGALVEFASAVDAVRCAMEIQRAMAERNAEFPKIAGSSSASASMSVTSLSTRAISMAMASTSPPAWRRWPGPARSVYRSNAYQQVKGKLALDVSDMGEQRLKNIVTARADYSVRLDDAREATCV